MNPLRQLALPLIVGCLAAPILTFAQGAGDYPAKSIELMVPYASGGGVANMARAFAVEAGTELGQQMVVTNKEGAGGVIGFSYLAKARPDGYVVAFSPASPMTNAPFINSNMPFRNDQVEPICQIFENVFAIAVKPDSPIRSFEDLIARAKAKPGALSFGHAGAASVGHMSLGAIEKADNVKFNAIAYRGDNPALTDMLGGTLDFAALGVGTLSGQNARVLAVLSAKRHPALPDVPSVGEFGVPAISQGLNGLYVPAGTPRPVVARLEEVCRKVAQSPSFAERAKTLSQVPAYLNARDFQARVASTYKVHEALVPDLKLGKN